MLAPAERDDVDTRRDLNALSAESQPQIGGVTVGPAPRASKLLSFDREAQRRFGIRWELLAAINFVESDFGRARTTARADAQGPMQFEPATWREYGMGGDVYNERDATLAAANLFAANGGRTNERAALMHYNRARRFSRCSNLTGAHPPTLRRSLELRQRQSWTLARGGCRHLPGYNRIGL